MVNFELQGELQMMTLDDIKNTKINLTVAREAHDQATKLLADLLDTKKSYEQKAFTLFSGFLTLTVAFTAGGVAIIKDNAGIAISLWITGAFFGVAATCLMMSLLDRGYGTPGSDPAMWLEPDIIGGPDDRLALMLAYVTFYYDGRISRSAQANSTKAHWIRAAVITAVLAPLALVISISIQTFTIKCPSSVCHSGPAAQAAGSPPFGTNATTQTNSVAPGQTLGGQSSASNQTAQTNGTGHVP